MSSFLPIYATVKLKKIKLFANLLDRMEIVLSVQGHDCLVVVNSFTSSAPKNASRHPVTLVCVCGKLCCAF